MHARIALLCVYKIIPGRLYRGRFRVEQINITRNVLMTIMTIMDYYWVSMSLDQYVDVTLLSAISVVVIRTP
jgi:hypothetical protein